LIEAYLQSLLEAITASPIVRASNVTLDRRTLCAGLIRATCISLMVPAYTSANWSRFRIKLSTECIVTTTKMPLLP
jgi:hypothetical protein